MADPNAQPGGGEASPSGIIPGDASAQWQSLVKELEGPDDELFGEESINTPAPQRREPPQREARAPEGEEPPAGEQEGEGEGEQRPKPTYEQLETHYRRTQGALRQEREAAREAREQLSNIS